MTLSEFGDPGALHRAKYAAPRSLATAAESRDAAALGASPPRAEPREEQEAVTSHWRAVDTSLWATTDLSTMRFIGTGGAPVPERLIRACLERGLNLVQGYGLSEAGPLVLVLDPASALRKVGAAGKPALFVDIRIVHADGLDALPERPASSSCVART